MSADEYDVAIIGAGAAGLMAAIHAGECGRRVLLLEKNKRPGVKILMSGGTRCNITQDTDNRGIIAAYGKPGKFLHSALAALSVRQTIEFFESAGCLTKVEETGKIFPVTNRATDVLAALMRRLQAAGVAIRSEEPLLSWRTTDEGGFALTTPRGEWLVPRVILTTGGKSFPGCGTTGDGYGLAASLGHTVIPTRPALVPLTSDAAWVKELRGVTLPDIKLRISDGKQLLAEQRGSLLFAHFGLTGPAALDVSRAVTGHHRPRDLCVELDLLPDLRELDLESELQQAASSVGRQLLGGWLSQGLPQRLIAVVLTAAEIPPDRILAELGKQERRRLVERLKRMAIPLTGALGFEKAEVTAGGIALNEVDSATMQSKLVPGLFLAGEVLDLDGPIGGYNFQAAWSTGWLAGGQA